MKINERSVSGKLFAGCTTRSFTTPSFTPLLPQTRHAPVAPESRYGQAPAVPASFARHNIGFTMRSVPRNLRLTSAAIPPVPANHGTKKPPTMHDPALTNWRSLLLPGRHRA
jgi:hypothetical protein